MAISEELENTIRDIKRITAQVQALRAIRDAGQRGSLSIAGQRPRPSSGLPNGSQLAQVVPIDRARRLRGASGDAPA